MSRVRKAVCNPERTARGQCCVWAQGGSWRGCGSQASRGTGHEGVRPAFGIFCRERGGVRCRGFSCHSQNMMVRNQLGIRALVPPITPAYSRAYPARAGLVRLCTSFLMLLLGRCAGLGPGPRLPALLLQTWGVQGSRRSSLSERQPRFPARAALLCQYWALMQPNPGTRNPQVCKGGQECHYAARALEVGMISQSCSKSIRRKQANPQFPAVEQHPCSSDVQPIILESLIPHLGVGDTGFGPLTEEGGASPQPLALVPLGSQLRHSTGFQGDHSPRLAAWCYHGN